MREKLIESLWEILYLRSKKRTSRSAKPFHQGHMLLNLSRLRLVKFLCTTLLIILLLLLDDCPGDYKSKIQYFGNLFSTLETLTCSWLALDRNLYFVVQIVIHWANAVIQYLPIVYECIISNYKLSRIHIQANIWILISSTFFNWVKWKALSNGELKKKKKIQFHTRDYWEVAYW